MGIVMRSLSLRMYKGRMGLHGRPQCICPPHAPTCPPFKNPISGVTLQLSDC